MNREDELDFLRRQVRNLRLMNQSAERVIQEKDEIIKVLRAQVANAETVKINRVVPTRCMHGFEFGNHCAECARRIGQTNEPNPR